MSYAAIDGLLAFATYFGTGLVLTVLYVAVYTFATSHNELALIRQNVTAAAVALGLSLIGFALPMSSAIVNARRIGDAVMWGLIAIVVQILTYWLVRLVLPNLSQRIANGEMSAALFLGAASLAIGIVNAASMTY